MSLVGRVAPIVLIILTLPACSGARPSPLAPNEVLRRAAVAAQALQSARLNVDATFESHSVAGAFPAAAGNANITGVMQSGGRQTQLSADVRADMRIREGESVNVRTLGELVLMGDGAAYMKIDALTVEPENAFFAPGVLEQVLGAWWSVDGGARAAGGMEVTPEPRLLQMQSQVVRVTDDHGIVRMDDRDAHHYDVALDAEKLRAFIAEESRARGEPLDEKDLDRMTSGLNATGELWIDAQTFTLLRASWSVADLPLDERSRLSFAFNLQLTDHDRAPAVVPPQDAKPFIPFWGSDPGNVPVHVPGIPDLPAGMEAEDLRRMLRQQSDMPILPSDL